MSDSENNDRITIWLDKESKTKTRLDRLRGNVNQSKAIRILLDYLMIQDPNFVRMLLGLSNLTEEQLLALKELEQGQPLPKDNPNTLPKQVELIRRT